MDLIRGVFLFIDKAFHNSQNSIKFPDITVERNAVYDDTEPEMCSFDVYYDKKQIAVGKLPVFINIHGGGFVKGDKIHRESFAGLVASHGWFAINLNYRLAPEHTFPAAVQDIFKFLACLPQLAEQFAIDLDKIVLSGDSAGGYYAAMAYAAMLDENVSNGLELQKTGLKPAGLASFSGIYDLENVFNIHLLGLERQLASTLFGEKVGRDHAAIKNNKFRPYFSPIEHINDNWGKIFLSYSTRDIFVKGQGEKLVAALGEHHLPYVVDVGESLAENHCYHLTLKSKYSDRCINKMLDYLAEIKG